MTHRGVRVITVAYRSRSVIGDFLSSLFDQVDPQWNLVVVDNSPTEDCAEVVGDFVGLAEDRVKYLRSGGNVGYLPGASYALRRYPLLEDESHVVVCNPDLVFEPDFISGLRSLANVELEESLLSPQVLDARSTRQMNPYLMRPPKLAYRFGVAVGSTWPSMIPMARRLKSVIRSDAGAGFGVSGKDDQACVKVYATHGSLFILPRRFFELGGSLDNRFPLYGEEEFIARQAREFGLETVFVPGIMATHTSGHSTGAGSDFTRACARKAAWSEVGMELSQRFRRR